ncbi:MAG: hypothetical protein Ct9H300mP28_24750 [Pseudomonadota bacterium]|nr:MAG: hypothetical protein Ct9H300mP28_24750 [Pseudomonadota bacterium]
MSQLPDCFTGNGTTLIFPLTPLRERAPLAMELARQAPLQRKTLQILICQFWMVLLNASQKRGTLCTLRLTKGMSGNCWVHLVLVKKSLWKNLSVEQRQLILYGNTKMKLGVSNIFRFPGMLLKKLDKKQWAGFIPILKFVNRFVKGPLEKFQHISICPDCTGRRLNKMALAVKI